MKVLVVCRGASHVQLSEDSDCSSSAMAMHLLSPELRQSTPAHKVSALCAVGDPQALSWVLWQEQHTKSFSRRDAAAVSPSPPGRPSATLTGWRWVMCLHTAVMAAHIVYLVLSFEVDLPVYMSVQ